MLDKLDLPPVWLFGFMGLAWAAAEIWAPFGDALLWPGRGLIAVGLGIAVWAVVAFRQARTTFIPRQQPSALVETGPFRFSRNPIYVADLVILAGWCLSVGQPLTLVLLWPLKVVLEQRFILQEEATLSEHLGDVYRDYCDRVHRWV
ncbi:MAG: isoprenylcysteine carboxylmethyltransferase family protein [Pseudomonadota bacterium]